MRKSFASVLAILTVLCMGTMSVYAASSITASDVSSGVSITTDVMSDNDISAVKEQVKKQDTNAKILGTLDVSAPGISSKDLAKGVSIKLSVSSLRAGDVIRILHYTNGAWEVIIPSVVGDGYCVATFYSLSPVAIVKYTSTVTAPSASYQSGGDHDDPNSDPSDPEEPNDSEEPSEPADDPDDDNNSGYPEDPENPDDDSDDDDNSGGNQNSDKPGSDQNGNSGNTGNGGNGGANTAPGGNGGSANTSHSSGQATVTKTNTSAGKSYATSPKTDAEVPVVPIVAAFTLMGAVILGRKAIKRS